MATAMTDTETLIQDAIGRICGIETAKLHPDATLSDLGVDSLAAAEVLVEVEIGLGRDLPAHLLRRLDGASTIRTIAAGLDSGADATPAQAQG